MKIGEPTIPHIFRVAAVTLRHRLVSLLDKDSLDLNDDDDRSAFSRDFLDIPGISGQRSSQEGISPQTCPTLFCRTSRTSPTTLTMASNELTVSETVGCGSTASAE
ncbi:MAG: hypothetical protein IZT59_00975 [Verrucomicrobia bacterium]|jgi:hypothetical protein|nr:hypothetical protein [Verrucomicrobiota bacterium]